jgi:hypothetical protein
MQLPCEPAAATRPFVPGPRADSAWNHALGWQLNSHEDGQSNPAAGGQVAATSADAFVANQMKTLAQAFRAQAEIIKKNKKNKKKKK